MKQVNRRLVLRGETLRALQVLDSRALAKVIGGGNVVQAQPLYESGRACTAAAIVATITCG